MDAVLYANADEVKIQSLYDDGTGQGSSHGFCDNREQAEREFNNSTDTYANYLITKVENGRLKLGIKKESTTENDWTCFNNFRLYRLPRQPDFDNASPCPIFVVV